jgi:hypothetical protein
MNLPSTLPEFIQPATTVFPASIIKLKTKQLVRELLAAGYELEEALAKVDIKYDTWRKHFERRYKKDPDKNQDFKESRVSRTAWQKITQAWQTGESDARACWLAGVSKDEFDHFMNLFPEREIEKRQHQGELAHRAKVAILDGLHPDELDFFKSKIPKAKLGLAVLERIEPEVFAPKSSKSANGVTHIHNNTQNIGVINNKNEPVKREDFDKKMQRYLKNTEETKKQNVISHNE